MNSGRCKYCGRTLESTGEYDTCADCNNKLIQADSYHNTHYSVPVSFTDKYILTVDRLEQEKAELIADAERLALEYLHAVQDIEGFAHDAGVEMRVKGSRELLFRHKKLMQKMKGDK